MLKTDNPIFFADESPTKVVKMGNITDLSVQQRRSSPPQITKISKDFYVVNATGELASYKHIQNRAQCYDSIRKSIRKLREIINANVVNNEYIRWVTLTYAENMKDVKKLGSDYENFWKRFKYYCEKLKFSIPEYIMAVEPQGRGAWHCHVLLIWEDIAPFIPNPDLAKIWGHGFVNIQQPLDVDNLGAYFAAYLTDLPSEEIKNLPTDEQINTIVASVVTNHSKNKEQKDKRIVKGARLALYPPGTKLFRCSAGVKRPTKQHTTYGKAKQMVEDSQLTYSATYEIKNQTGESVNFILKETYNAKYRKPK